MERYRAAHPDGYSLTQFRVALRRYERVSTPSMRMEHKAGDKLFVDYTGAKLWIYPPGEQPREVEVFVAILECSLLTYVEAVESQRKEDFITACENAFYYYGGVPRAIVPDNLKSAVTKASRYEAILNTEFERFGEHYGVTAYPTRARSPKDQANKMCSGILNFARKAGPERLATACRLADSYGKYSFREIQDILQNKSEAIGLPEEPADMPEHENIRGKEYYK